MVLFAIINMKIDDHKSQWCLKAIHHVVPISKYKIKTLPPLIKILAARVFVVVAGDRSAD